MQASSEHCDLPCTQVYALAAFAISPVLEHGRAQSKGAVQTMGNNLQCAPAALLAVLLLCKGGVKGGGSGDAGEVARQVGQKFANGVHGLFLAVCVRVCAH